MLSSFVSLLFLFSLLCCSNLTFTHGSLSPTPHHYRTLATRDLSRYRNTIIKTTTSENPLSSSSPDTTIVTHRRAALANYQTTTSSYSYSCSDTPSATAQTGPTSIKLPLYSGADFRVGEYITELRLGTPARTVKLFVDTGSDLTWVKCRYHNNNTNKDKNAHNNNNDTVFDADKSSSFKTVPCGSKKCTKDLADMFSLTTCPNPASSPCLYNYSYQGLSALGLFGEETITFPLTTTTNNNNRVISKTTVKIRNVIGCTQSTKGSSTSGDIITTGAVNGVLGMGYHNQSLGYNTAIKYGSGKFSYCLVDHLSPTTVRGYFTFGSSSSSNLPAVTPHNNNFQHTDLILGAINTFYAVSVSGISINGVMLSIPSQVWDVSTGGVIIDSGTSLTVLAPPAYKQVMSVMEESLSKGGFRNLKSTGMDIYPFEYCFNATTGFKEWMAPKMVVHFSNGVRFEPEVKSYVIDDRPGVKCVGLLQGDEGLPYLSIFGNILQQNYVWEFDIKGRKLGFRPSDCKG